MQRQATATARAAVKEAERRAEEAEEALERERDEAKKASKEAERVKTQLERKLEAGGTALQAAQDSLDSAHAKVRTAVKERDILAEDVLDLKGKVARLERKLADEKTEVEKLEGQLRERSKYLALIFSCLVSTCSLFRRGIPCTRSAR